MKIRDRVREREEAWNFKHLQRLRDPILLRVGAFQRLGAVQTNSPAVIPASNPGERGHDAKSGHDVSILRGAVLFTFFVLVHY